MALSPDTKSAVLFDKFIKNTGAIISGRWTYDITGGGGGNHPFPGIPVFVVSSHIPGKIPEGSTYEFSFDLYTTLDTSK